jgi:anti-sigma B factor antagonist
MKITQDGESLNITELRDLSSANSEVFRQEVCRSIPPMVKTIEVDLSQTRSVDSCGLGALIGIYKMATRNGDVTLRLVNPSSSLQQMFELTRLHRIFEVVQR